MNKFLLITIYSIIYGIYENNLVFRNLYLLQYLTLYGNWLIMWGVLFLIFVFLKYKFIDALYYILYFGMFEDIIFWTSDAFYKKKFPFPVGNWYDEQMPYFKEFNLGKATYFEPRVPYFYYVFIVICGTYFLLNKFNYYRLVRIWNLVTLVPMYTIIIGSIVIPKNVITNNGYLIIVCVQTVFYAILIIQYFKNRSTNYYIMENEISI